MNVQHQPRSHILAIDDNPEQLRILVEMLRQNDYRISVAFDGAQGYARAQASLPDLILLDIRMPKMDGFAVARLLKADPKTRHIPILILTSSVELDQRLLGLRTGAVDYIVKPYAAEEVTERVKIHLELAQRVAAGDASNQPTAPTYKNPAQDERGMLAFSGLAKVDSDLIEGQLAAPNSSKTGEPKSALEAINLERDRVLLRAASLIIFEHLMEPPRSYEIAEQLGVSERRLLRAFELRLDMTLADYIRQQRMMRAEQLLLHSSLSMVAIADEIGASSAANFSTAFKEYAGKTPSEFRKTARLSG
ncbi:response regulator [Allopusillimonas ginsengisoli]|uniref:response regulator n=1 Tax=Allopusillimonas ginsengisoli TaxID=453575 RepID=UPI0039C2200F